MAGISKLGLRWKHECFSEQTFFPSFPVFLFLLLKSASEGTIVCLITRRRIKQQSPRSEVCEFKLGDKMPGDYMETLGSGEMISGSVGHKDMEAAGFCSLVCFL